MSRTFISTSIVTISADIFLKKRILTKTETIIAALFLINPKRQNCRESIISTILRQNEQFFYEHEELH